MSKMADFDRRYRTVVRPGLLFMIVSNDRFSTPITREALNNPIFDTFKDDTIQNIKVNEEEITPEDMFALANHFDDRTVGRFNTLVSNLIRRALIGSLEDQVHFYPLLKVLLRPYSDVSFMFINNCQHLCRRTLPEIRGVLLLLKQKELVPTDLVLYNIGFELTEILLRDIGCSPEGLMVRLFRYPPRSHFQEYLDLYLSCGGDPEKASWYIDRFALEPTVVIV